MKRSIVLASVALAVVAAGGTLAATATREKPAAAASAVARGRYIVESFGCTDCHTPLVMSDRGPVRDLARAFSGHPDTVSLPPAPTLPPGPWNVTVSDTMTAWSGPWGTSFTANLTPDPETGLGTWDADTFVKAIRTGLHMGRGRRILPPMPVEQISNLTDDDLRAVFAFLRSVPAVKNRVPEPIPPAAPPTGA